MQDRLENFVVVCGETAFFETISASKRTSIERFIHDNLQFLQIGWKEAEQLGYKCVSATITVEF